ncbi:uncharacterized protein LOC129571891 [Sitodiplosis mosellana]|uniref:uncharacterized protein LOC129571891 n=1 Tax=Sitodiplosis mosellana TaxID=263140 RepID=UPI002444BDA1|nr:uncharacterized protein LOC129571891 [Sitodiplosis mosellana]
MFYNEHLIDIAEELLLEHLIRLPRVIQTGNEDQKATSFSQLKCFIILLFKRGRLQVTLSNNHLIEQLLDILLSSVEMERSHRLLEICNDVMDINDGENSKSWVFSHYGNKKSPWKIFKNIQNEQIIKEIETVCEYLNKDQHIYTFVLELLLKMLMKNSDKCNEVLVIIQMLHSNQFKLNDVCWSLHISIWENLLCDHRWNLVTDTNEFSDVNINYEVNWTGDNQMKGAVDFCDKLSHQKVQMNSLKEIKNNVLHTCLIIETVSFFATQMRQEVYAMKSLHYIVEKSSSKLYIIRASTFRALETIRLAYNFNAISDLLDINADYLIHKIGKSLDKPYRIDAAIHILRNTLRSDTTISINNIESIISLLIIEYSKKSQSNNSLQFIYAFKLILSRIHDVSSEYTIDVCNNDVRSMNQIRNVYYNHLHIWLGELHADRKWHVINQSDRNIINRRPENVKFTPYTKLAVIILKQVIPFLTSKKTTLKMLALDTINIGLDIIKNDENEFLPIVNLIWDTLIQQCIQGNDKVLLQYCFQVITKLSKFAKEIVKRRFTRELLPRVRQYINDVARNDVEQQTFSCKSIPISPHRRGYPKGGLGA